MSNELLNKLQDEYERSLEVYKANGRTDYEAGILEGLKRAIDLYVSIVPMERTK